VIRRRHDDGRGQSLVEFAIVFPIALLIIIGVFDVGRAVFLHSGLTNAAREGVRLAIVNQDKALVTDRVQGMALGGPLSNAGNPDDVVNFYRAEPNEDPTANADCSPLRIGCIAVVTAESDWTAITPIIGGLIGPITLEARSELPIEFVCPNSAIPAYSSSSACPKQP
jgi:Flp pilus assembly protein TadG